MRYTIGIALCLVSGLCLAQPEDPQLRREIQHVYSTWETRFARKDANGLASMMLYSGSTLRRDGTRWPYSDAKADFAAWFKSVRNPSQAVMVNHVRRNGDEVVVWITVTTKYQTRSRGRWVAHRTVTRQADTLKMFSDGWKFVDTTDLPREARYSG